MSFVSVNYIFKKEQHSRENQVTFHLNIDTDGFMCL